MNTRLEARSLGKVFNRHVVFENVSFVLDAGRTLVVTGRNGSGKSTLLKIIAGVLSPTRGEVHVPSEIPLREPVPRQLIGFVSPYLTLYEEFTAYENLRFAQSIRGMLFDPARAEALLARVSLSSVSHHQVRTFSSGMKQRLKYAFALLHAPPILLLDEPMANLDSDGIIVVREIMKEHAPSGLLVVATSDLTDVEEYDLRVHLDAAP